MTHCFSLEFWKPFHGSEMDGLFGFPIVHGSSHLITWSGTLV